jgi:hypothetical protein
VTGDHNPLHASRLLRVSCRGHEVFRTTEEVDLRQIPFKISVMTQVFTFTHQQSGSFTIIHGRIETWTYLPWPFFLSLIVPQRPHQPSRCVFCSFGPHLSASLLTSQRTQSRTWNMTHKPFVPVPGGMTTGKAKHVRLSAIGDMVSAQQTSLAGILPWDRTAVIGSHYRIAFEWVVCL